MPLAGQFADKYEKSFLIRLTKLVEIAISVFALVGFWVGDIYFLLGLLFLMGCHSAFFGPLKYSILPQQLTEEELLSGNSFTEGSTYIAILLGTAIGGILIMLQPGYWLTPTMVLMVALVGWLVSQKIPRALPGSPHLKIDWNVIKIAYHLQREAIADSKRGAAIYSISWGWTLPSVLLYALPAINKEIMHADAEVTSAMLVIFSIGLAVGSLAVNQLLKEEITGRLTSISIFLLGIFLADLGWFLQSHVPVIEGFQGIKEFFVWGAPGWHLMLTSLIISFICGFYLVPLYALVQARSPKEERARMIAALNINNAFFMVLAAILSASFLEWGAQFLSREESLAFIMNTMALISFMVVYPCYRRFRDRSG